jgi:putative hydrolase of the HAD superfamily
MKKRENGVKAIIFDIGGVLELAKERASQKYTKTKGVHEFVAKDLKISLDQYFDAIDSTYSDSVEGKISEKKALIIMAKNLKISPKKLEKIYQRGYKKNFKTNKELYKFAFNLRKQGYKIAILSDQWHISKKALVNPKVTKKFNTAIISCDVGMRKPDPKIYRLILKKLKIKPSESLFIDNQLWNIVPAKNLGMKTVLFKNNKQLFKQLEKMLK